MFGRRPDDAPMTLFHLILRSSAVALDERPRLNRFVAGGRIWQRNGIWLTFSAKNRFSDEGEMATVKRCVDPQASLDHCVDHLLSGIRDGKSERKTTANKEVDLLLRRRTGANPRADREPGEAGVGARARGSAPPCR
jgi:hypothetical protein